MKVLISGCTETVSRYIRIRPDRIGVLLTPSNGNSEWWDGDVTWGADNDCFQGLNAQKYLKFISRILQFKTKPSWISCPDKVADATETLRRFEAWQPMLRDVGLPVAFVGQDGLSIRDIPWDGIDCFFVGGSTKWKLGDEAAAMAVEAHSRGKLVHYGRVNTMRRIVWLARAMRDGRSWCDTLDGTGFSRFGNERIPLAIRWIDQALADTQSVLFGGTV